MRREISGDLPVAFDRCVGFVLSLGVCGGGAFFAFAVLLLFSFFSQFIFYDRVKHLNVIVECNL
jgi:hypothetical protein